jgi:hypothetical protein
MIVINKNLRIRIPGEKLQLFFACGGFDAAAACGTDQAHYFKGLDRLPGYVDPLRI